MRYIVILFLVILIAGCTQTVYMKNQKTSEVVECGPYQAGGIPALAGAMREAQCIRDYKEQGYVRTPKGPNN